MNQSNLVLDKAGAKEMPHREIAHVVFEKYLKARKSGGWWSQMVTVEYERERRLRAVNETADGFSVFMQKTMSSLLSDVRRAWEEIAASSDVKKRKLVPMLMKTKREMLRYRADIGELFVYFDERPNGKARIMIEAVKLHDKSHIETLRAFWRGTLNRFIF